MARPKKTATGVSSRKKKSVYKKYVPRVEKNELPEVPAQFKEYETKIKAIGLLLYCIPKVCEDDVIKHIFVILRKQKTRYHAIWSSGNWPMPQLFKFEDFYASNAYKEHMAAGFSV